VVKVENYRLLTRAALQFITEPRTSVSGVYHRLINRGILDRQNTIKERVIPAQRLAHILG
jgi:hypothetical protein